LSDVHFIKASGRAGCNEICVFYVILFMMVKNFLQTWKRCYSFNFVDSPGVAAVREKFFCVIRSIIGF
jgi:hypothetical protein